MAVTRNGGTKFAANSIRHNSFKLQAGMFDPTTLTGAYGFLKNKMGELLTRDNIVNELLIGTSFVFSIGLMLAMLINIFRRRAQGKVKWWHYPMIVLFFTVTTTLPVSAITLDPGSNGAGNLEVGETYFHKGYIGGTQATSDGTGKMKGRVSYDIFGKLAYKQDGAKDNFAAKGFGKELAQDQDGIVFHGKRLFDQDINRFMNVDPEAQYPSSYRYATDPAFKPRPIWWVRVYDRSHHRSCSRRSRNRVCDGSQYLWYGQVLGVGCRHLGILCLRVCYRCGLTIATAGAGTAQRRIMGSSAAEQPPPHSPGPGQLLR